MKYIYVQSNACRTRVNAEKQLQLALSAGINHLLYNVHQGGAHYSSAYYTRSTAIEAGFDPLGFLCTRGKELGIEISAWVCPGVDAIQDSTWQLGGKYGCPTTVSWLDFQNPAARQRVADICKDIVTKYPVGISLDYIRYPDVSTWRPAPPLSIADITQTVQLVRGAIGTRLLSAAVRARFYMLLETGGDIFQDWYNWMRTGIIDVAMPMTYSSVVNELTSWMQKWPVDLDKRKIVPIIPFYDFVPNPDVAKPTAQFTAQLKECTDLGYKPYCFFDSKGLLAQYVPIIKGLQEITIMTVIEELQAVIASLKTRQAELTTAVTDLGVQITTVEKAVTDLAVIGGLVDQLDNLI